jgi:protein involved in polysaccharide export with SLBB domain
MAIFILVSQQGLSQQLSGNEQQIRKELQSRGVDEESLRQRLAENGINPDSIQNASPEDLATIQSLVEELEKEAAEKKQDTLVPIEPGPSQREVKINQKPEKQPSGEPIEQTEKTTEQTVELFGHRYFNVPFERRDIPLLVNEAYILGSGDVLTVSIWSANAQFDRSFIVNNNGYIRLSDASQRIFVRGMTLAEAREKIRTRFRQFYRFGAGEFSVTLESARNIQVSVFGEVNNPGGISFAATFNVLDAIRMAGGLTEKGSVRQIRVIGPSGNIDQFDLYEYLQAPETIQRLFMEDGTIIHVPVCQQLIDLTGAIRQPARYEILKGDGLLDILALAGGFEVDAYARAVQVERFEEDTRTLFDVDILEMRKKGNDFELQNGDIIHVKSIGEEARNFVVVQGEVVNPGRFQRTEGMRIAGLLDKAGLKPESKTDFAFLKRKQEDGTSTYLRLNLDDIVDHPDLGTNLLLNDLDTLTVWPKHRFVDDGTISVEGAIRFPGEYKYDYAQKLHFSDALILAGGLSRDASGIAFIHRSDPLKPNEKQYIRVNLERLDTNLVYHENLVLEPFDRIEILSRNLFTEYTTVRISGPVNQPGEYQYGENMTLKDLVILSGGFKLGASTRNIEISRVLLRENQPTEITIAKVDVGENFFEADDNSDGFILEPYDHVKVRYVPEFEFQQDVEVLGEVKYPGIYTLNSKNEKIADLIRKAGGLTREAFPDGATLYRLEDSIGYIVLNLANALDEPGSKYNYILKDGDVIEIPKMKDFVSITGATKAHELYDKKLLRNPGGINVPYHENKKAGYYIRKYTGGLADNANRSSIFVEHPNGEIEKAGHFLLFTNYPEVRKGSVIRVGAKPPEKEKTAEDKKEVDWSKVISDALAQAMTIFTLILLARQATN